MGTQRIPIEVIWSDAQTRVGTPHIPFEVIWSDVQTRVGTPHYIERTNPYAGQMGESNVILDPSLALIRAQL